MVNGKQYVGQTIQELHKRWYEHRREKAKYSIIHRAILKYGEENFIIEQLTTADNQEELNDLEMKIIKFFNCLTPNGYNIREGGGNSKLSEETKRKVSEALKGRPAHNKGIPMSEGAKKNMSDSQKGKIRSEETREKIRIAHSGENNYMFGKPARNRGKSPKIESILRKQITNFTTSINDIIDNWKQFDIISDCQCLKVNNSLTENNFTEVIKILSEIIIDKDVYNFNFIKSNNTLLQKHKKFIRIRNKSYKYMLNTIKLIEGQEVNSIAN